MKVLMLPTTADLGIGRVVSAYRQYLQFEDVSYTDNADSADLVACHAGEHADGRQTDIHHCHGLYPTATLDKAPYYSEANAEVVQNARQARVVTMPSDWVADIFRRDMLLSPEVIPHGISVEEFVPSSSEGYILWAKGHTAGVCDPGPVLELAKRLPSTKFVVTFLPKGSNVPSDVSVIGKLPYDKMKDVISRAGVYLATSKETFGIQTLEAMACGVPVVGWNWGGTAEIVKHGISGWLCKPGDYDGLKEGILWAQKARVGVSGSARLRALEYDWKNVIGRVADVYRHAVEPNDEHGVVVSIVIPCYNYEHYIEYAIRSALGQDCSAKFEVIVVNDGSSDGSLEIVSKFKDVITIIDQKNNGVAEARNAGIRASKGRYIVCLDADDMMLPSYISRLLPIIEKDVSIGIVYGGLNLISRDGTRLRKGTWPVPFSATSQLNGQNCIPSVSMFRKDLWSRVGGYRQRYAPSEDAEFFLRIIASGYRALQVTTDPVYDYRIHDESQSRVLEVADWHSDKSYTYHVPFAAGGTTWPVRNYDKPWVTVVIPVSNYHAMIVHRAIDSVANQDIHNWEVIVVNDSGSNLLMPSTGKPLRTVYPFIRELDTEGVGNPGYARNIGAANAKSNFLIFLDADDCMEPSYIRKVVELYNLLDADDKRYVYTDWYSYDGNVKVNESLDYDISVLAGQALHPITALVPKAWHDEIGGFDESLAGWEDWDYTLKLAKLGHYGYRLECPLVVYHTSDGKRREENLKSKKKLIKHFAKYREMSMCVTCGQPKKKVNTAQSKSRERAQQLGVKTMSSQDVQDVLAMENSGNSGGHNVFGSKTGRNYGRHKHGDTFYMAPADQKARPHLYIVVPQDSQQNIVPQVMAEPVPPQMTVVAPVSAPSVPSVPVSIPATSEEDMTEVNISLLGLQQIKMLDLDPATAAEALEYERSEKNRKSVIVYLESVAAREFKSDAEETIEVEEVAEAA